MGNLPKSAANCEKLWKIKFESTSKILKYSKIMKYSVAQLCYYSSDSIGTWIIYGFLNLIVVH